MPAASPAPNDALFNERQSFLRPWRWWLILATVFIIGSTIAVSWIFTSKHVPIPLGVPLTMVIPPILAVFFAWLRLDTCLDLQGISYQMRPFSQKHLAWVNVRRAYVREYAPLGEYGGWGVKGQLFKNYALNVSGSYGLQLELADGRRLLLGTQRPEELRQALAQLGPQLAR